ncbi:Nucleic-acid-binding protein from mobile element jockey [Amphibalanus amphitrite]|uniref:Nucleic-acid-binding protein from mobile element jockey n=1 Tax=Amphibalanus amphitrite TaxID=1232801 RepID=A0A6A4WVV9_AMPAM|nr:Nucleic-acid-binding protein from mobile element jockey [Amphibalanus amphitrite]
MTKRGTVSTNNIILTFDSTDLPSEIRVGYVKVRVRPFVPAPMRCFRCQRFGHTKDNCRGRPTCSKCASQDHTDETCDSETPRCVNCGEGQTPHSAYDRSCPAYVKEKEIMTIKATRNLSFKEAREVYNQSHPKTSYAQKEALRRGEEERRAREARRARLVQKALEAKEASSADSASGNRLLFSKTFSVADKAPDRTYPQLRPSHSVPPQYDSVLPQYDSVPPQYAWMQLRELLAQQPRQAA